MAFPVRIIACGKTQTRFLANSTGLMITRAANRGTVVEYEKSALRVASLVPSIIKTVDSLGGGKGQLPRKPIELTCQAPGTTDELISFIHMLAP